MALGRWKQRALATDFLDHTESVSKKIARTDNADDRPSSGDSGISEEQLYRKCLSTVQTKCDNSLQSCIKLEPDDQPDDVTGRAEVVDEKLFQATLFPDDLDKENSRSVSRTSCGDTGRSTKKPSKKHPARTRGMKQEMSSDNDSSVWQEGTDSSRKRRIVANARERSRIHTIGSAFDALRRAVPSNYDQQKLSKLAILRIASSYIRALASLINEDREEFTFGVEQCTQTLSLDGARSKFPKSVS